MSSMESLRSVPVVITTTLLFALLLALRRSARSPTGSGGACRRVLAAMRCSSAVAQVFALIPGTSRSGVTMTAGLLLGMSQ
jgi:undecaprenyl-diphosphatase